MSNNEQEALPDNKDKSGICSNYNNNNNASVIKTAKGRLCHIVKRPDFDGYGFNLHSEKVKPGQYIGKVDANSPAEAAGLREGYQIIEVNDVNIGSETHKQVVQRIKAIANEVRLLLHDPNEVNETQSKFNEKLTNSSVHNNNILQTSPKSQNAVQPNMSSTASGIEAKEVEVPTRESDPVPAVPTVQIEVKEHITSISMGSTTKEQTQSCIDTTAHAITNPTAHNYELNDSAMGSHILNQTKVAYSLKPADAVQRPNDNGSAQTVAEPEVSIVGTTTNKHPTSGLNLNLTAAEMRAKLLARKKYDPKNESVDLKKKFEIIQKL